MLVPCAVGGVVHGTNAEQLRCRYVLEGANSPVTADADTHLAERGVTVVPDILANAGGVTVSHFEWVQNLQQFSWTPEEIHTRLQDRLVKATARVLDDVAANGGSLREAAYRMAAARVKEAFFLAGF